VSANFKKAKDAYVNPCTSGMIDSGERLDQTYQDKHLPVVKERLAQAGVRLADGLNSIFDE
jgi:hypothetical protein